jgi:beta-lactamase regulating signal transducer with metallopeptidase domain
LVIGLRRPTVLVPAPLLSALSEAELEDVLVHECAHVLRRDLVVGFLQRTLAVFCWLHPLIHYLNRQLSLAREEVCDNHVLRGGDARRYAGTLLTMAEHIPAAGALSPGIGLLSPHWKLEDRVAGLLDKGRSIMTRTNRFLLLFLFAALAITDIVIAGVRLGEATADGVAETPAETVANGEYISSRTLVKGARIVKRDCISRPIM